MESRRIVQQMVKQLFRDNIKQYSYFNFEEFKKVTLPLGLKSEMILKHNDLTLHVEGKGISTNLKLVARREEM